MKCLSKGCTNTSLLMSVELCYPCSQLVEQLNLTDKEQGCAECGVKTSDGYALYCVKCSEPMREWVGLTDEEIRDVHWSKPMDEYSFAAAIEAKLKEKNT